MRAQKGGFSGIGAPPRNVRALPLEPATESVLSSIAAETKIARLHLIRIVFREWLETIEENREMNGNA